MSRWNRHSVVTSKPQLRACKCSLILTVVPVQPCTVTPFKREDQQSQYDSIIYDWTVCRTCVGSLQKFQQLFSSNYSPIFTTIHPYFFSYSRRRQCGDGFYRRLCVWFFSRYLENRCRYNHQTWHKNVPRWVLKIYLCWDHKVKGQGYEWQNIAGVDLCTFLTASVFYSYSANKQTNPDQYITPANLWQRWKCVCQSSRFVYAVPVSRRPYVHVLDDYSPATPWPSRRVLSFPEDSAALAVSTRHSSTRLSNTSLLRSHDSSVYRQILEHPKNSVKSIVCDQSQTNAINVKCCVHKKHDFSLNGTTCWVIYF